MDYCSTTAESDQRALGSGFRLGHAIHCAAHLLNADEPFAVILPDVLVKTEPGAADMDNDLKQMVQVYQANNVAQTMVEQVPLDRVNQ